MKGGNVRAQFISKLRLGKNSRNSTTFGTGFSDVKTGHRTPDTEHLKIKNGPEGIAAFGGEF